MKLNRPTRKAVRAFTLIEVLIASAVLAVTLMGILAICANGLRIARALQHTHVDASSIAAWTTMTNRLEEGVDSGNFNDLVGDLAPGANWQRQVTAVGKKGLFRVDFIVEYNVEKKPLRSEMSIFLYRPDSAVPARLQ
mgnify:CR=1 FL=1